MGYFLASPLRRLWENPEKILQPYLRPGMKVLDVGCGMGYFSFDVAKMVRPGGKVVCVDLQERMIRTLVKRARRRGLLDLIDHRVCSEHSLGIEDLAGELDFAIAFHVAHETPDAGAMLAQVHATLKAGAQLLLVEPKGHVSVEDFRETLEAARRAGFSSVDTLSLRRSHAELLAAAGG
jgi:ubiquinone/menaquinone biosynthesis C-methylase UbiE